MKEKIHTEQIDRHFHKEVTLEQLSKRLNILSELCLDLNPYLPLDDETKNQLKEFHITEFHDPFTITNKLLVLLDEVENEIKNYNK